MFRLLLGHLQVVWENGSKSYLYYDALWNPKYCFNKQCLANKVIPSYANIKFQNPSPVAQFTSKKLQTTRVKDENKFLFKKKDKFNREL